MISADPIRIKRPWDDAAFLKSIWVAPEETEEEYLRRITRESQIFVAEERARRDRARGWLGAFALSLFIFALIWFGASL